MWFWVKRSSSNAVTSSPAPTPSRGTVLQGPGLSQPPKCSPSLPSAPRNSRRILIHLVSKVSSLQLTCAYFKPHYFTHCRNSKGNASLPPLPQTLLQLLCPQSLSNWGTFLEWKLRDKLWPTRKT